MTPTTDQAAREAAEKLANKLNDVTRSRDVFRIEMEQTIKNAITAALAEKEAKLETSEHIASLAMVLLIRDFGYSEEPTYGHTPMRHQNLWMCCKTFYGERFAEEVQRNIEARTRERSEPRDEWEWKPTDVLAAEAERLRGELKEYEEERALNQENWRTTDAEMSRRADLLLERSNEVRTLRAENTALKEQVEKMKAALKECAETFERYVTIHGQKTPLTDETQRKMIANHQMATKCRAAITAARGERE